MGIRSTPAAAGQRTLSPYLGQPGINLLNPVAQHSLVGFQLRFTSTAQTCPRPGTTAGPTTLTIKMGPASNKPGGRMIQLSKFNLQFAFMGSRSTGKNFKDQPRSPNNPALQRLFQVSFLGW